MEFSHFILSISNYDRNFLEVKLLEGNSIDSRQRAAFVLALRVVPTEHGNIDSSGLWLSLIKDTP